MESYLLLARSVTHAQQMMRGLEQAGIRSHVQRAAAGLSERGCGYTLSIAARNYPAAMQRLRNIGQKPIKIFRINGEERTEVTL